ncbi:hypothetical protein H072_7481 [Dactylellina haptotyla CBS 200.50]|uniref:WD40 repeat-like protein n=1 Tax=Dactylellina haptotyla (strain CBS 200.50) TaxID=1284197 RepID=S8A701_DACHA|nr:hypothetical protein H072_7481 [Dactylellina haptotyla CBS 200.50]
MSKRHQNKAGSKTNDANSNWKVVITTATEVDVWNGLGERYDTVFTSGTEGIVSAKLAKEGNVLAVAGSQVVLLHKIERGQQQSYKLKGADATRLLEYAADGKSIFLNSSLRNSIQTYNVRDDKISETLKSHPSPVTSFATSLDSNLVLSASPNPPTIHIDNLSLRTTSQLKPQASDQTVILSTFHPTRKNLFMIGFSDGVLAAYDYSKASKSGQHIHAFGHLHDAMMGGNGITAAEFIPGSQTKAMTAGEDGKCTILDFDKKIVVGSFRIGAPATSLAIRSDDNAKKGSGRWLAAVGTLHGWFYVYDQDGNRLHEVQVDREGNRILEVKWKLGDIKLPITAAPSPRKSPQKGKGPVPTGRTPQGPKPTRAPPMVKEEPIVAAEKPEAPFQFPESPVQTRFRQRNSNKPLPNPPSRPEEDSWEDVNEGFQEQKPAWEELQNAYTADYMSIFSPVKNEPLRNSPRRSSRLSIRSINSPSKEKEDKITTLIKQDDEGLLRPSVSSPSLATMQVKSPAKAAPNEPTKIAHRMTEPPMSKASKKERAKLENKLEEIEKKLQAIGKGDEESAMEIQEAKPAVPSKDGAKPEPPKRKDFAPHAPPQPNPEPITVPSLPSTDSKAVEDFRKVRAKLESGHNHPVLSLFSSHLPNQKTKNHYNPTDSVEGKENTVKTETKAEKKRVKIEEKERRRSAKEEKKRKKKEGSFPPVSDLVFKDDDMEIDGHPHLELPSISPKVGNSKRKAADDLYEAPSGSSAPRNLHRAAKGKEKIRPSAEPEDIWIPEELRKPSKRLHLGGQSPVALRDNSQQPRHDGTMSIHDMIADLKRTFVEEITALKSEMNNKFERQNEFMENLIRNERSEARSLREENERLRAQIAELAKGAR